MTDTVFALGIISEIMLGFTLVRDNEIAQERLGGRVSYLFPPLGVNKFWRGFFLISIFFTLVSDTSPGPPSLPFGFWLIYFLVSFAVMLRIENGRREPTVSLELMLATATGLSFATMCIVGPGWIN